MAVCSHLDAIRVTTLPEPIAGCEECLKIGSRWVHLRMCMTCGEIGCCDSSPNRHASRHAASDAHPIARSAEQVEDWSWCYVDAVAFVVASGGDPPSDATTKSAAAADRDSTHLRDRRETVTAGGRLRSRVQNAI